MSEATALKTVPGLPILKMGHSRPLFLYIRLFNTVDSKQYSITTLPMSGFEPRTSGVRSDSSLDCTRVTYFKLFYSLKICLTEIEFRIGTICRIRSGLVLILIVDVIVRVVVVVVFRRLVRLNWFIPIDDRFDRILPD